MWHHDFNIKIPPVHHTGGILIIYSIMERSKSLVSTSRHLEIRTKSSKLG